MTNVPLVITLARNDLRQRYRGSLMGNFWLLITPLVTLLLYAFVFSTIFKARWQFLGASEYTNYALVLFPGLMMFQVFIELLQKGANAYDAYTSITTKLNIDVLDLILASVLASFIPFLIAIGGWYVVVLVMFGASFTSVGLTILCLFLFGIFCVGATLLSSVLGALIKDWIQLIGLISMGFLFLSPILYPVDHLPEEFRRVLYVNPLSHFIEIFRQTTFDPHHTASVGSLTAIFCFAVSFGFSGLWLQRALSRFVDA
ncbi:MULTISPECIES: ABC transporter permease [unclassified Bradyrhizobium]|uniref:ABC transporter permease n=1 Tax=unclassified Bradyrhizobium TaxID=2631580 RepID=UPI001FFC08E6|nr:ABC transporter permease [Bradyrhizobium sp. 172]MCK1534626.1 ABC transporter permease [Bradyrhizobium sp. 176]MCK1557863.1 ABC transporter permease [Bradyrhizobium sp. 171]UPJ98286.1 ABC transporter permease [Bradyrhizobium sp. 172]